MAAIAMVAGLLEEDAALVRARVVAEEARLAAAARARARTRLVIQAWWGQGAWVERAGMFAVVRAEAALGALATIVRASWPAAAALAAAAAVAVAAAVVVLLQSWAEVWAADVLLATSTCHRNQLCPVVPCVLGIAPVVQLHRSQGAPAERAWTSERGHQKSSVYTQVP